MARKKTDASGRPKNEKKSKTKTPPKAKGEGFRTDKFEFFYSKFSPFSQHFLCKFEVEKMVFNSAEQYMMYQKARIFKDKEYADLIMKTDDPVQQKKYGRKVRNFDPKVWGKLNTEVVERGNLAKFRQNPEIKDTLLKTHPRELVEASPRDRLWGIGLGMHNPKARDKSTWRGKNLLGTLLTKVRDTLREEYITSGGPSTSDESGTSWNKGVAPKKPKDHSDKGVKRKLEVDGADVNDGKKPKLSKKKDNEFQWVEKTKESMDETTEESNDGGNGRKMSRESDNHERERKDKKKRDKKRARRKEKKRRKKERRKKEN